MPETSDETVPAYMQCCIDSLMKWVVEEWKRQGKPMPEDKPLDATADEGAVLNCDVCPYGMIFRNGNWEWLGADYGDNKAREIMKS